MFSGGESEIAIQCSCERRGPRRHAVLGWLPRSVSPRACCSRMGGSLLPNLTGFRILFADRYRNFGVVRRAAAAFRLVANNLR